MWKDQWGGGGKRRAGALAMGEARAYTLGTTPAGQLSAAVYRNVPQTEWLQMATFPFCLSI